VVVGARKLEQVERVERYWRNELKMLGEVR
jgi:hypothetical protein